MDVEGVLSGEDDKYVGLGIDISQEKDPVERHLRFYWTTLYFSFTLFMIINGDTKNRWKNKV